MTVPVVLDSTGRRRSPATMPGYDAGRPPRNMGMHYPADPPTIEEIVAVMRLTGEHRHGWRVRGLIVVLWRGGQRIHEALALTEHDLHPRSGSLLVRSGKGGKRRELGMDQWGSEWPQLGARVHGPRADSVKDDDQSRLGNDPARRHADQGRAQAGRVGHA